MFAEVDAEFQATCEADFGSLGNAAMMARKQMEEAEEDMGEAMGCSEVLDGRACFASSSTCANGASQTANEFCLAYADVSGSVSRTCSGADTNQVTRLS
jgi:hypothetical protein